MLCQKLLVDSKVLIWRIGVTQCEFKHDKTWETLTPITGYAGFTYPRPGAKISTLCQPAEPFIKIHSKNLWRWLSEQGRLGVKLHTVLCTLLHEFLHVCTFTPTDNRMSILQILRNSKKIITMQEMPSSDKIIWDDKTSSNPDKGIILNIPNNCSQNIF